jgi:hypothetical protein
MTPITLQGIRPWRALLVAVFAMALTVQSIPVAAQSVTIPPWRVSGDSAREKATITVGEHKLVTDLALTSKQQQLGLGYRNSLGWDEAMLFVNKAPEPQSFWMRACAFASTSSGSRVARSLAPRRTPAPIRRAPLIPRNSGCRHRNR